MLIFLYNIKWRVKRAKWNKFMIGIVIACQCGLLTDLNETSRPTPKRESKLYKFNAENYGRLKDKGFRIEFWTAAIILLLHKNGVK